MRWTPSGSAFALLLVLAFLPRAIATEVILVLKNGDRISGSLVSESASRVVLKSPVAGKLKIATDQIARREDPAALKAAAAAAAQAAAPAQAAATAKPANTSPPVPVPAAPAMAKTPAAAPLTNQVAASQTWLQTFAPAILDPFLTNWHGNIQMGMDLGFGTTDRQTFYGNATATHSYGRIRNFADFRTAYGLVNKVNSAERTDGSWKIDVDLGQKRRIYLYNQIGAGYDKIRLLDLQFQEGAGVGYKILQRQRLILSGEFGGQAQLFDYAPISQISDRHILSVRLGESLTWSISDKLKLTQKAAFMPNVEDFGDYRARLDFGLSYPLLKKVTININIVDEYDSNPPPGVDKNDLQIQSTVGIVF